MHQSQRTLPATTAAHVILVAAALMMLGLVMVASAGANLDRPIIGGELLTNPVARQFLFVVLALFAAALAARYGHNLFAWHRGGILVQPTLWLALGTLLILLAVLVPGVGVERHGARRWMALGAGELRLVFQPSELAKVGVVVFLAAFLSRRRKAERSFAGTVLPVALGLGACVALVGIEDFGTAVLIAVVGGLMLFVAGVPWRYLSGMGLIGGTALAALLMAKPYRLARLTAFADIWSDPRGSGYHAIQSLAAIASGGWWGRGLGAGVQKYGYLPETQTDFVFGLICEETGVVGGMLVLALFGCFLWLGWRIFSRCDSTYTRLLCFGATVTIGLQAAMNVAVVTACAPTKGIALPFVSAGGSGLVCLGALVGLLANCGREAPVHVAGRGSVQDVGHASGVPA